MFSRYVYLGRHTCAIATEGEESENVYVCAYVCVYIVVCVGAYGVREY